MDPPIAATLITEFSSPLTIGPPPPLAN